MQGKEYINYGHLSGYLCRRHIRKYCLHCHPILDLNPILLQGINSNFDPFNLSTYQVYEYILNHFDMVTMSVTFYNK